jgi:hypothetical protein
MTTLTRSEIWARTEAAIDAAAVELARRIYSPAAKEARRLRIIADYDRNRHLQRVLLSSVVDRGAIVEVLSLSHDRAGELLRAKVAHLEELCAAAPKSSVWRVELEAARQALIGESALRDAACDAEAIIEEMEPA